MTSSHLQLWIEHPEHLNKETLYELRTLVARYPYFQTLRLLYLKNLYLLHDITFGAELRKAVLYVADRRVLFYLIEGDRYTLPHPKLSIVSPKDREEEPGIDRTLFLIDTFLSTVPEEHLQNNELDYSMDYTSFLSDGNDSHETTPPDSADDAPRLRGQDLIDGFLGINHEAEPPATYDRPVPVTNSEELDDSCFTETLAKIYIKQGRYDKALEIIKKLSLNYPKKNAYFADQIRFLEKLIINAKSK